MDTWRPARFGYEDYAPATEMYGSLVRRYRIRRRLSQVALAERIGADHSYISRLESGARHPSMDVAIRIADALDVYGADRVVLLSEAGYVEYPLSDEVARLVATDGARDAA